ncbi:hypothetical protein [Maritalea porphyrae]|uniref:hypothetical protein n=1 Tax=Maritalea porphyrae TaxID=880732 RepID=UPI0022AEB364|nr:hypothetical protein [Maritalea porphyrae]MCZ4272475.1 hypothetical protein [Maritalea porphyrae]
MSNDETPNTEDLIDVGTAIAKSNDVASKGPIGHLLNPSAKLLGEKLEHWTKKRLEKKQKRAQGHIAAVKDANPELDIETSVPDPSNMAKWLESANSEGEGDETDAKWRAVLESILADDDDQERMIQVAKNLTREDIRAICAIPNAAPQDFYPGFWETTDTLKITFRLPAWSLLPFFLFVSGLGVVASIILTAYISILPAPPFLTESNRQFYSLPIILGGCSYIIWAIQRGSRRRLLTPFGGRLRNRLLKYTNAVKPINPAE